MTDHKRKNKGRREDDMEQSYSKSTVQYLKISGLMLAILSFIGGINTMYMSSIADTVSGISKTVNETHIGMKLNARDIKFATKLAVSNKQNIDGVVDDLADYKLKIARGAN